MLNWIVGFCHKTAEIHVLRRTRLAPSGYRTQASAVGARRHNDHTTGCRCVANLIVYLTLLPRPSADPGHITLPGRYTRNFSLTHFTLGFSRINLHDGSNPSFFLHSLAIRQFPPWPETHFTCLQKGCSQTLLPSDHHPNSIRF